MMQIIHPGIAEHYSWGGACDGWHLLKTDGLSVIQERVPPGGAEIRHFHRQARQFFYMLSGRLTLELGTDRHILSSGQGCEVPPGIPHRVVNDSREEAVFLVISAPKSHGDRVQLEQDQQTS